MKIQILESGVVCYPHKGEIPPDIRGYKRMSPTGPDAWKFTPIFPPCANRVVQPHQRGCGTVGIHLVCKRTKAICTHENWNPCKDLV